MKLPYVIDNQAHRLADILKGLLAEHKGRSLDVATAYFTVGGFALIKRGLLTLEGYCDLSRELAGDVGGEAGPGAAQMDIGAVDVTCLPRKEQADHWEESGQLVLS
ncbi:MAG: hypothetical protein HYT78_07690 [Deltaproteobacteria bacterium]|nr:hypothetical protein [Deltaproteobacteria bacterium]